MTIINSILKTRGNMLSFEEKVMALATIRALGLVRAVEIMAKTKRSSTTNMRVELDQVDSTHYLLDNGMVEYKKEINVVQYTDFKYLQQPCVITEEFYDKCKSELQQELREALTVLHCETYVKKFKPAPFKVKKLLSKYSPSLIEAVSVH